MTGVEASLVVPSYRGADRLPVLFEALRAQRFDGEWEAVVVLDGVEDASPDVIEAADDLPLRPVRLPENRGRPAALNAGFAQARGRVLIRCDDDLEPDPGYVANHVLAHGGPHPVGAVGLYRNVFPSTPYARVYGEPYDRLFRSQAYESPDSGRWRYWAGNCSVIRSTFDLVGGYDERFRSYGWEDIDWGFRLATSGARVVVDPRLETRHHAANVNVEIRVRRAFLSGRAQARFVAKHHTGGSVVVPRGLLQRAWVLALRGLVATGSLEACERRGAALDRVLGRLPTTVAIRAVALLVESAARAGYTSFDEAER